jgi:hypothetical protein
MKLIGRLNELTMNEIFLYGCRPEYLHDLSSKLSSTSVIEVKEYVPRKRKKFDKITGQQLPLIVQPDLAERHQIKMTIDLEFMRIYLYSIPLSAREVKEVGLSPIEKLEKKEKTIKAMRKMDADVKENTSFKIKYDISKDNSIHKVIHDLSEGVYSN